MVFLKNYAELYRNHSISGPIGQNVSKLRLLNLTLNDNLSRGYRIKSWTSVSNKKMGIYMFFICVCSKNFERHVHIFCSRTFQSMCWVVGFEASIAQSHFWLLKVFFLTLPSCRSHTTSQLFTLISHLLFLSERQYILVVVCFGLPLCKGWICPRNAAYYTVFLTKWFLKPLCEILVPQNENRVHLFKMDRSNSGLYVSSSNSYFLFSHLCWHTPCACCSF